jgi:D-3-phosphoglycerate dehydrogenase / 2-oxoglutarate reductase
VGLGSIGQEVVKRARAFEMRVLAHDPYVTSKLAQDCGVELVPLARLYAESDYITLHVASTPETQGMLSREAFQAMKPGVRVVNCARGELVDEAALVEALASGKLAGAAVDVYSTEPPPAGFPLFLAEGVVATPHIGGSTEEAQEIVGVRIAEQVVEYLKSGVAINAVNMPAVSREQYRVLKPYVMLAERLGHFAAQLAAGNPGTVRLVYFGRLADGNTNLLRNAGLAGVLTRSTSHRANLVNAMQIAESRGWNVAERHEKRSGHADTIRIEVDTDTGITSAEGAVVFDKPRLLQIDGIQCEATLGGYITFMKNQDVPGVIGHVGSVLGRNRINIANFSLGRRDAPLKPGEPLEAIALVTTDEIVPEPVLAQLKENPAVRFARSVEFRE